MHALLFAILAFALTQPPLAWGCPQYPHAPPQSLLVEENLENNGLLYRLYDLDRDGGRDYGLAFQTGCKTGTPPNFTCEYPLFYLFGDTRGPTRVFVDIKVEGRCEDIRLYWSKGEKWPRIQAQIRGT